MNENEQMWQWIRETYQKTGDYQFDIKINLLLCLKKLFKQKVTFISDNAPTQVVIANVERLNK